MEYVEEPLRSWELRAAPCPVLLVASQHILTLVEWLLSLYATVFGMKCWMLLLLMWEQISLESVFSGAMKPFFMRSL